jgi:hypothetical protein
MTVSDRGIRRWLAGAGNDAGAARAYALQLGEALLRNHVVEPGFIVVAL